MADYDDDRAEAGAVLLEVMGEVGERLCPENSLRSACAAARAGIRDGAPPYAALAAAAGLGPDALPADDEELWLTLAAGVVLQPDGAAAQLALHHWLATLAALTLWGPGTQADPPALAVCVSEAEEDAQGDLEALEAAFAPVVEQWRALDALDATERLTRLGWWGLPEAQCRAWSGKY